MKLQDAFELNCNLQLENRFSKDQWENIINIAFSIDQSFNDAVVSFYTKALEFDYVDCEDLIIDIENGDGDAFERFVDDILYYFNNDD